MAETKLTTEEVYNYIDDYGVIALGGASSGIKADTNFIATITGAPFVKTVFKKDAEGNKTEEEHFHHTLFPVEIKTDKVEGGVLPFKVRVGDGAVERFNEKYADMVADESYIGKQAFFKKVTYNGNKVHHISLILNGGERYVKPTLGSNATPAKLPVKEDTEEAVVTEETIEDVVEKALPTLTAEETVFMKELSEAKEPVSVEQFKDAALERFSPERYAVLLQHKNNK